jgi:uncharacterized membrane protein YuzA (DUF378 family)
MKALDLITGALLVVGGLNWGLVAIAEFDLVAAIVGEEFGETNALSRIVYGLVGLSAVYQATRLPAFALRERHDTRTAAV